MKNSKNKKNFIFIGILFFISLLLLVSAVVHKSLIGSLYYGDSFLIYVEIWSIVALIFLQIPNVIVFFINLFTNKKVAFMNFIAGLVSFLLFFLSIIIDMNTLIYAT